MIPLASIIMQYVMTRAGAGHIRPEELSESVRGPYWLVHGRIFQGLSSHIGWYAPLILWYKIFGFTLRGAADYRFVVHVVSIICLAFLLKKYLGEKFAWIPLAAIGFSPTLLYFNSLATHFGIDFQYLPICLMLLDNLRGVMLPVILWSFTMIAWMSYPTMVYYVPALAFLYLYKMRHVRKRYVLISIVSFLLPLMIACAFVQNRTLLLYDAGDHSGIFRGAAHTLDLPHGWDRVRDTVFGFFSLRPSYYYEVKEVEFSDGYPLLAIITLFGISMFLWIKKRSYRLWILLISTVVVFTIATLVLFSDTGGVGYASIRRATGFIASVYMLLVLACYAIKKFTPNNKSYWLVCLFLFALIPVHHLIVFFPNVQAMSGPSRYEEATWFHTRQSPNASLLAYQDVLVKDDLQVTCPYKVGIQTDCTYNRLYAVVSASCFFNHQVCHQIWGWDPFRNRYERFRLSLWEKEWVWEKYDSELDRQQKLFFEGGQ
jgi:hypothetical protein